MPSPNCCNQSAVHSSIRGEPTARLLGVYLCRHTIYTLTFGRFRLPRSGLSSGRSSRFRSRRLRRVRYFADLDSSTPIGDLDPLSERRPFEREKRIMHMFLKLYRGVLARDSAPPLHVRVPPREFDGLPSAGAAPALWTGTQEPQGTDHPPMNQQKTPIGKRHL